MSDAVSGCPPDAQLVERFRGGDESAFDEIVRRHQERVFQFAYRLVQDYDDAGDIAQETFVRAYARLDGFRTASALYTWLHRIAANLGISLLRRRKLQSLLGLGSESLPAADAGPERDFEARETGRRVRAAVAQLPPRQRTIFVLRQYEGLSHGQIAQVVGRSEGAVRAGYFHAIRKLQVALRDLATAAADGD